MRDLSPEITAFGEQNSRRIGDWLVESLLKNAQIREGDNFYPHSFINLFEPPLAGIEQLYSDSALKAKRALRTAVLRLGAAVRPSCPDLADVDIECRLNLFDSFTRLVNHTLCFEAVELLSEIACEDAEYWRAANKEEEIFATCTRSVGTLAMRHNSSTFWNARFSSLIELSLVKIASSPMFKPAFSPFVLAALSSIAPQNLFDHLNLLGKHVSELHSLNQEQRDLASLTARRIVERAPLQLIRRFSELDFRFDKSKDRWLVDALFSRNGPLVLTRVGKDVTRPKIALRGQPNKNVQMVHNHWIYFTPDDAIELVTPNQNTRPNVLTRRVKFEIQNFFRRKDATGNSKSESAS